MRHMFRFSISPLPSFVIYFGLQVGGGWGEGIQISASLEHGAMHRQTLVRIIDEGRELGLPEFQ